MWSSAKGSGMRSHRTPGATSCVAPPQGGAEKGNSRVEGMVAFTARASAWNAGERERRALCDAASSCNHRGMSSAALLFMPHDYGMLILHVWSFCAAAMPSASPPEAVTYSISELAKEFALTTRAIRFYEGEGLLAPQRAGQRRVYAERERVRIKLILRGKRLRPSLSEIPELLELYEATKSERPQLIKFLQVLSARRAMLKQQQEDIA